MRGTGADWPSVSLRDHSLHPCKRRAGAAHARPTHRGTRSELASRLATQSVPSSNLMASEMQNIDVECSSSAVESAETMFPRPAKRSPARNSTPTRRPVCDARFASRGSTRASRDSTERNLPFPSFLMRREPCSRLSTILLAGAMFPLAPWLPINPHPPSHQPWHGT
ncbi:uncharacterized protein CC84DRAFT_60560 [Paraphaeosphaeria sporulosa]|uniref:Uncharacterized protein n=1 Tax=Paraphaeosphaeria sporulosa TaxID=1460663 RepID=A0A177CWM3_9PLEO|nr:uncharacterized protein CC84DRAFT_60560 [Paraphaeosphaeria sporulosa]OAG11913.1 hypothetical protein CC84DRAFT_60560 [Paraphaeosphaeria sporulosa]